MHEHIDANVEGVVEPIIRPALSGSAVDGGGEVDNFVVIHAEGKVDGFEVGDCESDDDPVSPIDLDEPHSSVTVKMTKHLARGGKILEFFPRAARNTIARVKGILCDLLWDVIDANSPGAYYDAWAKFFSLPRRILAVNSRGGQNKGPRKHSDQVDRLIARYVQEGDADEEGEDAQVGDDYEGDARFVDENGRDMGPVDRDARKLVGRLTRSIFYFPRKN
jgi:hypothetical protein